MSKMTRSSDGLSPKSAQTPDLEALLDRYGPDLTLWPDPTDADRARKAALSDRRFRAKLDAAKKLAEHIAVLSEELDDHGLLGASAGKIELALMAHAERRAPVRRAFSRTTLMQLAATVLIACAVGVGVGQYADDGLGAGSEVSEDVLFGLMDVPFVNLTST